MPTEMLSRKFAVENLELRSEAEGDSKQEYCDGMGVVYDREEELWDGYFEKVSRTAFDKWLKKDVEVKCFFNHDANQVLSTTRSTPALVLENTDKGLWFRSPIPNTDYGKNLIENLKRKNVRGASFTFIIPEGGDIVTRDAKGNIHREIVEANIFELGPVTCPAYRKTKSFKRDMRELVQELKERLDKPQVAAKTVEDVVQERVIEPDVDTEIDTEKYSLRTKQNENLLNLYKLQLDVKRRSIV